ncbi:hypothetical protein D3C81_736940 [compost metagenome]
MNDPCTAGIRYKFSTYYYEAILRMDVIKWSFVTLADQFCTFKGGENFIFAFKHIFGQTFSQNKYFGALLNARISD